MEAGLTILIADGEQSLDAVAEKAVPSEVVVVQRTFP